jgi:hypothetical protein
LSQWSGLLKTSFTLDILFGKNEIDTHLKESHAVRPTEELLYGSKLLPHLFHYFKYCTEQTSHSSSWKCLLPDPVPNVAVNQRFAGVTFSGLSIKQIYPAIREPASSSIFPQSELPFRLLRFLLLTGACPLYRNNRGQSLFDVILEMNQLCEDRRASECKSTDSKDSSRKNGSFSPFEVFSYCIYKYTWPEYSLLYRLNPDYFTSRSLFRNFPFAFESSPSSSSSSSSSYFNKNRLALYFFFVSPFLFAVI